MKTMSSHFDSGEAMIETVDGFREIEYLEVDFKIIQRAYPSQIGRLLAYEDDQQLITNVEERTVSFGNGETLRIVITGSDDANPSAMETS